MDELLYQFLIQYKKLSLPGIGSLIVLRQPAQSDFFNKAFSAPAFSFAFDQKQDASSKKLFSWLSTLLGCTDDEAIKKINDFCIDLKSRLHEQRSIQWSGVGSFKTDEEGNISFEPETKRFFFEKDIIAEKVLRANPEHRMMVGEVEKTSSQMTELLSQPEEIKRSNWWVWPLIIGIIAITFIGWYFSTHGLQTNSSGLQHKVNTEQGGPTYKLLQ
ncbi:MAG TPA: hypothetical protein VIQ00_02835 [Chitinophagaceae bacterium]